jgi:hypothetical protein
LAQQKIPMRLAALSLGIKRVQEAKRIRGIVSLETVVGWWS